MNSVFCTTWNALCRDCTSARSSKRALSALSSQYHLCSTKSSVLASYFPFHASRHRGYVQTIRRAFHVSSISSNPRARPARIADAYWVKGPEGNTKVQLSERGIRQVFKGALSRENGNDLLSKLQAGRENGTPDTQVEDYTQGAMKAGLNFLRIKYPVDEEAAILARIDKELDHEFRLPQADPEYSRNQNSGLEKMRKENIKRNEREEAQEKVEREKVQHREETRSSVENESGQVQHQETKTLQPRTFRELLDPNRKPKEPPDWVKRYRRNATDAEIVTLSPRRRLLPSGLFTLAIVLLSLLLADTYIPPSRDARMFPDTPPAAATLQTILTINIAVFLLWRVPQMWRFMNKYFINLPIKPRAPQMLLAAFSHQDVAHLVVNMMVVWFVGVHLHDSIGRGPFLALVFSSAVVSSYTGLVAHVLKNLFFTSSMGASGIASALIAAICVLHEGLSVRFPFLSAEWTSWVNTGVIISAIVIRELFSIRKGIYSVAQFEQFGFTIDHIGHLAGYATGAAGALLIRRHDPKWRDVKRKSFWYRNRQGQPSKSTSQEISIENTAVVTSR